jgi:arylsulfatase A-like enzyme
MPTGRTLYWHYPHYHGSTWAPGSALRDGDWKLVENFHYGTVELFNLRDDLGETRDLAKTNPEVTAQLLAKLHAWQKSVNAIIPGPNTESTTAAPAPKKAKKKAK